MKNLKHTKGEWGIETQPLTRPKDCKQYYITANNGSLLIAEFKRSNHLKEEAEANAKIIAAGPDMLEALVELKKDLEYHGRTNSTTYLKTVLAINKATK